LFDLCVSSFSCCCCGGCCGGGGCCCGGCCGGGCCCHSCSHPAAFSSLAFPLLAFSSLAPRLLDASSGALDYLYRSVALFPDGAGYALGSVEGRATIKYLDGDAPTRTRVK